MKNTIKRIILKKESKWLILAFAMVIFTSGSYLAAEWRADIADQAMRDKLYRQVVSLAKTVNPEYVSSLSFTIDDLENPVFHRMRNQLTNYQSITETRGIYTMVLRDGELIFGPESYAKDDPQASPPGTVYFEPDDLDYSVFDKGVAYVFGPVTDEYGTFVSAVAPVVHPRSGEVLMAVGLDIEASDWNALLNKERGFAVLCVLILILILFGGIYVFQYRLNLPIEKQGRLRYSEVYFVAVFCLALTVMMSLLNHEEENSNRQILFNQLAESKFERVLQIFDDLRHNELGGLSRYFKSSEHVTREDFKTYTKPEVLPTNIFAIAWAPRVLIDDLNSFQQAVREEGLDDFILYQVDGNGRIQSVSERDEYFPLLYVEPFEEQIGAIGFDLASEPTRKAAIDEAILTGMKSATDVIYTVDTNDPVILSIAPLYSDEVIPYYGSDYSLNEQSVSGLLTIALRNDALLTTTDIVGVDNSPSSVICMHQLDSNSESRFITSSSAKAVEHNLDVFHDNEFKLIDNNLTQHYPLFAFGKTYLLAINPGEAFLESYPSRAFCKSFGIGLVLTILITAFALVLTNRRLKLETEVQKRTSELKESNERLYFLAEMSRTVTWEVDVNGLYTYISPVCKTAWGYDPEEIVGKKHFYDLFPEEYRETIREEAFALMRQHKAFSGFENAIVLKNGYRIWVITYGEPILDDNGDLVGYRGSDIDITERKLAEKKLKESEEQFRTLFMETSASILIHDKDTGEIIDANPAACKMYGLSTAEELKTRTIWFDEPPYTFEDAVANIHKAATDGAHSFEWLNRKVTGELYWDHVYLSPVNINGVQRVMAITLDITDRKRAETELQMQSELWRLMMKISSNYINMPSDSVDDAVNTSLGELAKFIDADRAYVFNYDFETETCSNTNEWCAKGIEPQIDQLQNVPLEAVPDWVNTHRQGKAINIADVSSLPLGNLRDILEPQSIKSLLTVPMMDKDKCIGFVGFDAVKQHHTYTDIEENLMMIFTNMLVNVNHRRQAEEAIRNSEERYRDLFTSSRDGIVVVDINGSINDANAAYCDMLGYRIDELRSMPDFYSITPEKWRQWEQEEIWENRLMKVGFSGIYEKEYIRKDGSVIPVELQAFTVRDETGKTKYLWAIVRDITERKTVESALKESETRHRMLFEASQDAMMTVEPPSWKFTSANPATIKMLGVNSVEEFTNLGPWDISPEYQPDGTLSTESAKKAIQTALDKGSHLFDWMHQRLDGKPIYAQVHLSKMEVSGKIVLQAILRDISVQKKAEEALKAEEARMRAITESAQDAVIMMDPDGNISFWNPAAERTLGYSKEEVIGKNLHVILAPEKYHSSCKKALPHFQKPGQGDAVGKTLELEAVCKDGYVISVELSLSALELSDGWHAVGIMRDISDRKQAEEEILSINRQLHDAIAHANEMAFQAEMANAAKSDFLANMSHEIRTPMNGVIGMIGLLLNTRLDDEQHKYAETVRSSAESLLHLINDILDFSKIEAKKFDLEYLDFDLTELLDDFAYSVAVTAHQKGIEFICAANSDVPTMLHGDPGRLRQILTNLTVNAIKFTHEGEISIRVFVDEETDNDALLRFAVRDTGIGIPQEKMSSLFDKFVQVDPSTTRKYGGTGLGLAISKELVELMGGEISVSSEEGEGSEFSFTARFGKSTSHQKTESHQIANLKDVRVLIVDDNQTNCEILTKQLSSWGMRISEVHDGISALSILNKALDECDPFQIAIIDMQMPGMDGESLGRAIKADERLAATKMLMLTSLGIKNSDHQFEKVGFFGCLTKPVRNQVLSDVLSQAIMNQHEMKPVDKSFVVHRDNKATLNSFKGSKARVLIVEDNITNQQVALGILKKLGLQVDSVADGQEALKMLESIPYDLVLMDVQMPVMDGFEATKRIRNPESAVLNHDIPVIAMTAHAMQGDKEKCLKAGMNDYISKPVTPHKLHEILTKWLCNENVRDSPEVDYSNETESIEHLDRLLDWEELFDRVMGDKDFAYEIVDIFINDVNDQIARIESAISENDVLSIEKLAHRLKGSSSNVCSRVINEIATRMETASKENDLEMLRTCLSKLKKEYGQLVSVVKDHSQEEF